MKPRLLDLFCGAGGAAMGYQRAGFYVVGVDIEPQPNYCGDEFNQADAIPVLEELIAGRWAPTADRVYTLGGFNAIHASPPCQLHSSIGKQIRGRFEEIDHGVDLIAPTRELLITLGLPYVIENVPGAPLRHPVTICGSALGLDLRRHRLFESNVTLMVPPCSHGWQAARFVSLDKRRKTPRTTVPVHGGGQIKPLASVVGVHGHINYTGERELREKAMGIDWMTPYELTQAIPPAYTELIGLQLIQQLQKAAA